MDQNNELKDTQNFGLNPYDFNTCFLYQQPYVNVSPYAMNNEVFWSYPSNTSMNSAFNHSYTSNQYVDTNCQQNSNRNDIHNKQQVKTPFVNNNNFQDGKYKPNASSKTKELISTQNSNKNITARNNRTMKTTPQHYEILTRKTNLEDGVTEICKGSSKPIDIDKDFPPISITTSKCSDQKPHERENVLDFRLALQKPKKVEENIIAKTEVKVEDGDTTKKKRKRKRKKKVSLQTEEVKSFEFVDDEFPNLDMVQKELSILAEKSHEEKKPKEGQSVNHFINDKDKKKSRRHQLLFILPKDMEGQVRIVDAKSIKKSKIKRKVNQDRMKRPIGLLNPMNLSGPTVKRGKERLIPKVKKPSKLKKTILLCRSLKRQLRETIKNVSDVIDTGDNTICEESNVIVEVKEKPVINSSSKMHSKNFREYCNHMVGNNINSMISTLLKTLITFQDKLYNRDPIKAKMKRRLCFGLREVTKFVNMKKIRLIVIAPDLEKVDIQGGLDDIVGNIIKVARETSIPCVFGLNRSSLAYLCFKKFRVGAIGIFNFDGAEGQVKELLKAVDEAREQYNQLKIIMESITNDVAVLSGSANHQLQSLVDDKDEINQYNNGVYVGHSRTPSNALSEPISEIIEVNKSMFNSIFEDQNHHNLEPEIVSIGLNEGTEDSLINVYVDDCLDSISKLTLCD